MVPAGRTFPSGTEMVYINRTTTPVEVYEGVIQPCSEFAFDQAAIDRATAMRRNGTFPPPPAGSVDLTQTAHDAPGKPKPLIIVILEGDEMRGYFGSVPDAELPPCQGQAVAPT